MARVNSKNKGNGFERKIANIFNERFKTTAYKRNAFSGSIVGGSNREKNMDLSEEQKQSFSSDIVAPKESKFIFECKAYKTPFNVFDLINKSSDILSFFKQVSGDAEYAKKKPMLIIKYDRKDFIVFIREKPIEEYILETKGWYCYMFEDLLKLENSFWMNT